MYDAYFDLAGKSIPDRHARLHQYVTLQFFFILYLVLGQVLALWLWRLFAPLTRGWREWAVNLVFGLYLLSAQAVLFVLWPLLIGAWQQADNILLADIVVVAHLALAVSVLLLLLLVPIGGMLAWTWTRNFWLRLAHLIAIEVIAGQAIVKIECPMQTLEHYLRGGPGQLQPDPHEASAAGYWANQIMYAMGNRPITAIGVYSAIALLVLVGWVVWPPRAPGREREKPGTDPASG